MGTEFPQDKTNRRVLLVSYRLPSSEAVENLDASLGLQNEVVVSGVNAIKRNTEVLWIGHDASGVNLSDDERSQLKLLHVDQYPVMFPSNEMRELYNEYCKLVLWPLFHYYGNGESSTNILTNYKQEGWETYTAWNELVAEAIVENYREGDLIFIQDYHFMLLPSMVRQRIPKAKIGWYCHIPWPSSELYRSLPVRNQVLHGLLGADVLGFQTFAYVRHFLSACTRLLGLAVNEVGVAYTQDHFVRLQVEPVGVDPEVCKSTLKSDEFKAKMEDLSRALEGKKVIVSRDRMQYIKGIPHKLRAFASFLQAYPEWRGKVVLFQHCRPNMEVVKHAHYSSLVEEIEQLVGRINGDFGDVTFNYTPVYYLNKMLSWPESCALFAVADVCLVTALRDGMNLTPHEFVLCQEEKMSPVILSEFTGAAQCLSGALLINPWDELMIAKAINTALTMDDDFKRIRYRHNYDYVVTHTARLWISFMLDALKVDYHTSTAETNIERINPGRLVEAFKKSEKRLLLFDYDGTLTPIVKHPKDAAPSKELLAVLRALSANNQNFVYIVTGRDRATMENWLGNLPVGMACEHGCFWKFVPRDGQETSWESVSSELDLSWQTHIKSILEDFTDRTPGSFLEMKEINMTWHYRNADPEFGELQKNDLLLHLSNLPNLPIDILVGKMSVEVRPTGVNKGSVVKRFLNEHEDADFVLCIGDDKTDEDMFEELRKHNAKHLFTVTVEKKPTMAKYYVEKQNEVVTLLTRLAFTGK